MRAFGAGLSWMLEARFGICLRAVVCVACEWLDQALRNPGLRSENWATRFLSGQPLVPNLDICHLSKTIKNCVPDLASFRRWGWGSVRFHYLQALHHALIVGQDGPVPLLGNGAEQNIDRPALHSPATA